MIQTENKTDEQLLTEMDRENGELIDYLLVKYKPLVIKHANRFFIMGGETQDLIQEGMIGLFHAIRDYREEKKVSFLYFADMCVRRQMYHAMESAAGKKNEVLNSSVSLDDTDVMEMFGQMVSPEELFIEKEELDTRLKRLGESLSEFERQVLLGKLAGLSTAEISEKLGVSLKQTDNAMTRIKTKAKM